MPLAVAVLACVLRGVVCTRCESNYATLYYERAWDSTRSLSIGGANNKHCWRASTRLRHERTFVVDVCTFSAERENAYLREPSDYADVRLCDTMLSSSHYDDDGDDVVDDIVPSDADVVHMSTARWCLRSNIARVTAHHALHIWYCAAPCACGALHIIATESEPNARASIKTMVTGDYDYLAPYAVA